MPWGRTGGFARLLSGFADGLLVPDCSTMKGRVNGLGVDLGDSPVESNGPVGIAVDASGIEVHDGGDRIRLRCGHLQLPSWGGDKAGHRQGRLRAEERGEPARRQAVMEQRKYGPGA